MNREKNIVLIGMSGAGKSTLGVLLAKALGKHFVDTDIVIQKQTGRLLQELLDTEGVARFLEIEEETMLSLSATDSVISTGGSVVYSEKAMQALRKNGTVVYLSVAYDELVSRLSDITTRGIVFQGKNDLQSVYEERLPLYERYADVTVQCTGKSIEDSVREILQAVSL